MKYDLIAIIGPTASGKTARAVDLARAIDAEIISADSRQVYSGMDLGTGKDLEEYGDVPYHLIDIRPAGYKYNLHEFLSDFQSAYADIRSRGRNVVLCGGTGMYVEAAINNLQLPQVPENPELRERLKDEPFDDLVRLLASMKKLHNTTDYDTRARLLRAIEIETWYRDHPEQARLADKATAQPLNALVVCVDIPREARREKISRRLRQRLDSGMVEEVRRLLDSGIQPDDLIYYGLEYKFLTLYATGQLTYEEMVNGLEIAIHQFAKRQMTWIRGMERRGFTISYLPYDLGREEFVSRVQNLISEA